MKFFLNHIRESMKTDTDVDLDTRWRFLEQLDVVSDEGNFVIGEDGILTPEELHTTLKVRLTRSYSRRIEVKENECQNFKD